jgi:ribosome-binding factor A
MESKRQQKVARQLQKDLSDIFQKEGQTWFDGAMVTITIVRVSPDLAIARVYLSFLLAKQPSLLLESIRERTKQIRQLIGARVRHQLRIVPDFVFFLDDSAEYAAKMEALFANIDIPKEETEN